MYVTLVRTAVHLCQLLVLIALLGHMQAPMAPARASAACLERLEDHLERLSVQCAMPVYTVPVLAPLFVFTALLDPIQMCLPRHAAIPVLLVRIRAWLGLLIS